MVEYSEEIELKSELKQEKQEKQILNIQENSQQGCQSHGGKQCSSNHGGQEKKQCEGHSNSKPCQKGKGKHKQMIYPSIFYNFMVINHYIFMYVYLQYIEISFDYWVCLISFNFLTFMSQLCYFTAMFTNNKVGFKMDFKKDIASYSELFMTPKPCETCKVVKCGRINHCSQCNQCQNRMDHHCPWTLNCIAQRNHKSFFLYNMYLSISIAQNQYYAYYYYQILQQKGQYDTLNSYFKYYWIAYMCMQLLIFFWVMMLFVFHGCTMMSNVTTLENMKGVQMKNPIKQLFYQINIWDQGLIANIIFFLDNRYFLWWYPTINYQFDDGHSIPKNPSVSKKDQLDFKCKQNPQLKVILDDKNKKIDYEAAIEDLKLQKNIVLQYEGQLIKL